MTSIFLLLSLIFHPAVSTLQGETMHTYYHIKILPGNISKQLKTELKKFLSQLDTQLSSYVSGNEISHINENAGIKGVRVSSKIYSVIHKALEIARSSNSAFDPTIGPLVEIWDFKNSHNFPPSEYEIERARALVDWRNVELINGRVFLKKKGMKLQLSGIAKGYGVDLVAEFLREKGIKNALVEIGGEIYCWGKGPQKEKWRVGITHPLYPGTVIAELDVSDVGIATSGNYENYINWQGKKYGHILDPRTGYPVTNDLLSVTILAPTCMEADAWATAIFVLGWNEGRKIILQHPELEGVIIKNTQGRIELWTSPGIRDKIILYD